MIKLLQALSRKIELWNHVEFGTEEGDHCNRKCCPGTIERGEGSCCCSVVSNPPCGYCESNEVWCPECGWEED